MNRKKSRVFLLDTDAAVRRCLARLIEVEPGLTVCGQASGMAEALERIPAAGPDAVVVSLDALEGGGVSVVNHLRWEHPGLPLVAVSMREETVFGRRLLQAGAAGYVTKSEAARRTVPAIRRVLRGGIYAGRAAGGTMRGKHDLKPGGRS